MIVGSTRLPASSLTARMSADVGSGTDTSRRRRRHREMCAFSAVRTTGTRPTLSPHSSPEPPGSRPPFAMPASMIQAPVLAQLLPPRSWWRGRPVRPAVRDGERPG